MPGGTAFQPTALQSNAFEIAGGVAATELQVTIGITQDSDLVSVTLENTGSQTHGFEMGGEEKPRRRNLVTILPDTPKPEKKTITKREIDRRVFEQAREQAVSIIERAAKDHATSIRTQPVRYGAVRTSIKPLAKKLGGWDWVSAYQRLYDEALREQIAAELAIEDVIAEEDAIIMMLLENS